MSDKITMLDEWVKKLIFPGNVDDFVKVIKNFSHNGNNYHKEILLYTDEYRYRISAIDRDSDNGYLGCQVSARKARAGEDWTRGNDLPDGPFDEKTWSNILNAIVNYELVELSKFRQPDAIPAE